MKIIDTHTHIYLDQFDEDRDEMMSRALDIGVERFYLPNVDLESIPQIKSLVSKYPQCYPMMGLHPCSVDGDVENIWKNIKEELEQNASYYIAVGEIGIDLYWDKTFIKEQEWVFREQIKYAKKHNLPIVIHCREAFDEILAIMDEENDDDLFGIFHCFTGNTEQGKHILNYGGFKLGIGGVVTFKNGGLDKTLTNFQLEDIVLETDAPYLAPAPNRGKRNEPVFLEYVVEKLAALYNVTENEVAEVTTQNAIQLFHGK